MIPIAQTHPEKKSKKRKRSQDDDMKDTRKVNRGVPDTSTNEFVASEKGDKKKRNKHKGKPDAG